MAENSEVPNIPIDNLVQAHLLVLAHRRIDLLDKAVKPVLFTYLQFK